MDSGWIKLFLEKIPIKKLYARLKMYCKENISIQLRKGKSTMPDPLTGFIHDINKDGTKSEPFCPQCWYNKRDRIPLHKTSTYNVYRCNVCERFKRPANYVEPRNEYTDNFDKWLNG